MLIWFLKNNFEQVYILLPRFLLFCNYPLDHPKRLNREWLIWGICCIHIYHISKLAAVIVVAEEVCGFMYVFSDLIIVRDWRALLYVEYLCKIILFKMLLIVEFIENIFYRENCYRKLLNYLLIFAHNYLNSLTLIGVLLYIQRYPCM